MSHNHLPDKYDAIRIPLNEWRANALRLYYCMTIVKTK